MLSTLCSTQWKCCTFCICSSQSYIGIFFIEIFIFEFSNNKSYFRNFSIHKNDYCSKKMPFMHLFIGFITIIPSYEFYEYLLDREPYIYLQTILNLKVVVRLIHVYLFFSRCRVECGTFQLITINQILKIFFRIK